MTALKAIPSLLTAIRIGLALAFPFLEPSLWGAVVVVACLTEYLDGFLARKLNAVTILGQIADPIADKLFVGMVCFSLIQADIATWWHFLGLFMRDIAVVCGIVWGLVTANFDDFREFPPRWSGKVATAFIFGFLLSCVFTLELQPVLFWLTALSSTIAGLDYMFWYLGRRSKIY